MAGGQASESFALYRQNGDRLNPAHNLEVLDRLHLGFFEHLKVPAVVVEQLGLGLGE